MSVLAQRLERTNARVVRVQKAMYVSRCIPYRRKAERIIRRGEAIFAGLRRTQIETSRLLNVLNLEHVT